MNDDLLRYYMLGIDYLRECFGDDRVHGFQKQDVESDAKQLECESVKLENAEVVDCEVLE